jgi:hypothetical protein
MNQGTQGYSLTEKKPEVENLLSWQPWFAARSADFLRCLQQFGIQNASEEWKSADFPRNLQQFGIQNVSEEWKSADFPRNLQQFGIQNVSEEWKSADFLRNLQQFRTKNHRNGNTNPLPGMSTFLKF